MTFPKNIKINTPSVNSEGEARIYLSGILEKKYNNFGGLTSVKLIMK